MIRFFKTLLVGFFFCSSLASAMTIETDHLWPWIHDYFKAVFPREAILLASSLPKTSFELSPEDSKAKTSERIEREIGHVRIGDQYICRVGIGFERLIAESLVALAECLPLENLAATSTSTLKSLFGKAKKQMFARAVPLNEASPFGLASSDPGREGAWIQHLPRALRAGKIFDLAHPGTRYDLRTEAVESFKIGFSSDPSFVPEVRSRTYWSLSHHLDCELKLNLVPPFRFGPSFVKLLR